MKLARTLSLTLVLVTAGTTAWAAEHDKRQAHHPANSASASAGDMAKMDTQMKVMRDMHDKMMAAKTPEERQALMAEHMKTMQDGMSMMNGMAAGGMGGMACMDDKKGRDKKGDKMKGEMHSRHQMMEKRMQMMQSMMQMMMDRMPATPAK